MERHIQHSIWTALIALTLVFVPAAGAQHAGPAAGPAPNRTLKSNQEIGKRLAHALASPADGVRKGALEETIFYAQFSDGQTDLTAAVPVLITIYRKDPVESYRLAAVAALHAIGDEAAMQVLRHRITEQTSRRVQLATLGALADYYGLDGLEGAGDLAAVAEGLLKEHDGHKKAGAPVVAKR